MDLRHAISSASERARIHILVGGNCDGGGSGAAVTDIDDGAVAASLGAIRVTLTA